MQGITSSHIIANNKCSVYLPPYYRVAVNATVRYPVVYLLGESNISQIAELLEGKMPAENGKPRGCKAFILVGLESPAWERDYSPWRGEDSTKETPFTGGADKFLATIKKEVVPFINKAYRTEPADTAIAGYSMAGLTALYAVYTSDMAQKFASVSGSLWFRDWVSWAEQRTLKATSENPYRVYMSLGNAEAKTANPQMATVETCTEKTYRIIQKQLQQAQGDKGAEDNLFFEYNKGGHFDGVANRIAKALLYLEAD